eukprot:8209175-Pyramimonas_sp.AAC.1
MKGVNSAFSGLDLLREKLAEAFTRLVEQMAGLGLESTGSVSNLSLHEILESFVEVRVQSWKTSRFARGGGLGVGGGSDGGRSSSGC